MRLKAIEFDREELPELVTLLFTPAEFDFIENHVKLPHGLDAREGSKGVRIKLPVLALARIGRQCDEFSGAKDDLRTAQKLNMKLWEFFDLYFPRMSHRELIKALKSRDSKGR